MISSRSTPTLVLIFVIFFSPGYFSTPSFAQTRPPTLERVSFYRDVGRLFKQTRSYITDASRMTAAENSVDGIGQQISDHIEWTSDQGALIEVRVEKHPNPDIGVAAILGEPVLVGFGDTPSNVLAMSIGQSLLRPNPRDGFVDAPDLSFFIWAENRSYRLGLFSAMHFGYIPPELSKVIRTDALRIHSDQSLVAALRTARIASIQRSAIERLENLADNEAQARRIRNAYETVQENREKISDIRNELNRELAKIEQANDLVTRINQLKAILDVAIFVAEFRASFPEDANRVENVRDADVLRERVDELRIEKDGFVLEWREELRILRENQANSSAEIRSELSSEGAPREVRETF